MGACNSLLKDPRKDSNARVGRKELQNDMNTLCSMTMPRSRMYVEQVQRRHPQLFLRAVSVHGQRILCLRLSQRYE